VSEFTLDAIPFAPTVTSITATTDTGATDLNAGHVITIAVGFNGAVNVTGSPFLQLNDHEIATYSIGSGTDTLKFSYTVQPGDNVLDLQVTGLDLNGGTIHDSVGGTLSGVVQGDLALQIDTTPPVPFMSDVTKDANDSLTTLSGMSEANSKVSVYDGTNLLGTVTADSLGIWSLASNISGNGLHKFTETASDVAGNNGSSAGVTVYSPTGNKTLTGGTGNDFLIAGPNDTLKGGAGNDTFVFNANFGKDIVKDFDVNHDVLAFSHTLFTSTDPVAIITQLLNQTHDTTAGAVIVVDAHDTITLNNVTKAQLAAHVSDFHFF
jgi:hypothetical protein